jgi:hypothetical protein
MVRHLHETEAQVFFYAETGEDPAVLGDQPNSAATDQITRQSDNTLALKTNFTSAWRYPPCNGFDQGGFTYAVASEESDNLASPNFEVDTLQYVRKTVVGMNIG